MSRSASLAAVALAAAAVGALPASAGALGLPPDFGRAIVITSAKQDLRVSRLEVAAQPAGSAKVRVKVRVRAATVSGQVRRYELAIAPCRGGAANSPSCPPAKTTRLTFGAASTTTTRTVTVPRPAKARDALRVTLNRVGATSVAGAQHVGGGGGSGEVLLNTGTWRFQPGTWWGLVALPPAGITVDSVKFNSRLYEWTGRAESPQDVVTSVAYTGEAPVRTFADTMQAGAPFRFDHTPGHPVRQPRTAPRSVTYQATAPGGTAFAVTVPLGPWSGR